MAGLQATRARGKKPGRRKSLSANDLKLAETMLKVANSLPPGGRES